ncbi:hypothetical protein J6590_044300 [Homalodisca vitripennis]|nr:hypothetical protein J6590_044300 [Homalodisca vitripennis]
MRLASTFLTTWGCSSLALQRGHGGIPVDAGTVRVVFADFSPLARRFPGPPVCPHKHHRVLLHILGRVGGVVPHISTRGE